MTDRYCVFGNPVAHSRSPAIHARFAAQCHQDLSYEALLAPLDGFSATAREFVAAGGKGANVTLPFKEEAFGLCTRRSARAERAGAVNTLDFTGSGIFGDNTDGAGLVRDIEVNLGFPLAGKRLLLLGAGGAARGVIAPILERQLAGLFIANRNGDKADALAGQFSDLATVDAGNFAKTAGRTFDVVINATSASLSGAALPLPAGIFAPGSLAYDMMYGKGETPFLALAREQGAAHLADGLGMLVEQAAEAFLVWRGVRPDGAPVLAALREQLAA
ncbi:MAG: shikimate dehydrogenase [Dechloromonas sp.]|uniref:Shikimate dehydrogenase (NADP(+)) n=1 Tax=Candidatus Dechloromonas phosphorivorans TaxID=2899244 RepID=A0A9D7LLR3_9RHOO|nr:shikimate dehydrogenase [Candidatus Dechloromonas phosphorivorans]